MSLRCSVLGHDFGESEVEREQEREGSEVVVTVREYETCRRCGDTKLISENTNVTAAEDASGGDDDGDVAADQPFSSDRGAPSAPDASTGTGTGGNALTPPTDGEDDAEILGDDADGAVADADGVDEDDPDAEAVEAGATGADDHDAAEDLVSPGDDEGVEVVDEAEGEADPEPPTEDPEADAEDAAEIVEAEADAEATPESDADDDAVTDDGVILDEPAEPTEREHGEWPEADAQHPAEAEGDTPDSATAWPETEADAGDEGFDAAAGDDPDPADVDLGDDLAPEDTAGAAGEPAEGHDAEFIGSPDRGPEATAGEDEVGSGITRSASAQVPDGSTPVDRPTEFHCPRCDHVVPATRSSLRAGDICPECSMGYLAERER